MVSPSLRTLPVVRDSPAVRTYWSLFVLLLASQLLEYLIVRGVAFVSQLVPDVIDPRVAGAVVYAVLGAAAFAGTYGVVRARRPQEARAQRHEIAQFGGVTAMVLLAAAYLLHGATDVPVFPGQVLTSFLVGSVAMGVPAFAYANASEFDLHLDVPGRATVPLAGVVLALGAITGLGQFAVAVAPGNPLLTDDVVGRFGPRLSAGLLAWRVVVPGICISIGMALLYNGAVQERLRERLGPAGATAAVTALAGVLGWAFVAGGLTHSAVGMVGALAAVVLLSLLGAAIAVRSVRLIARRLDGGVTPVVAASVGVAVVAVPHAGLVGIDPSGATIAAGGLAATVVVAVASVAYERSRSVWIPALAFVSFQVVGDSDLLLAIAGVIG